MTIQKIIPKSEKSLRPTSPVTDFTERYIRQAIQDLLDTLKEKQRSLDVIYPNAGCGVGLASNQIEYPYEPISDTDPSPKLGYYPEDFTPPNIYVVSIRPERAILEACEVVEPSVYINATCHVDPLNRSKSVYEEGCLSVNGFTGVNISRYENLTIDAYNESGTRRQFTVSGFIARVHQHEIDHGLGMEYLNHLNFTHDELMTILRWIETAATKDFSELSEWIIPNKLKCIWTELDLEALQTWTSHQLLKQINAAATSIQGFFTTYHLKKQVTKPQAIKTSTYSEVVASI